MAVPLFVSNILFYFESGYFGADAELNPLLHTWSLAVEEQYYFLFPIFLIAIWRFKKRAAVVVLSLVAILSLIVAQRYSVRLPPAAFYLLPTRGWEILLGVLIAFYLINKNRPQRAAATRRYISSLQAFWVSV
jgi:peptidoglycan/LPS O-acetylase OafA/YrhL